MRQDCDIAVLRRDVADHLRAFSGQSVRFYPNPGNAGDCLILAGTLSAFAEAGVNPVLIDNDADISGETVIIGGGGNFINLYDDIRRMIEACHARARRFVLLPHTVRGHADVIAALDARAMIWCRDQRSYEHVRILNPRVDCRLGHDMAFHCHTQELLRDANLGRSAMRKLDAALRERGTNLQELSRRDCVRFLRTDREAADPEQVGDLDISRALGDVSDAQASVVTAWCFLKTVSVAQRIVTDRLHVAIAAAMLGIACELLDNAYDKNREVFAHSLAGFRNSRFRRLFLQDAPDQPPPRRRPLRQRWRSKARSLLSRGKIDAGIAR